MLASYFEPLPYSGGEVDVVHISEPVDVDYDIGKRLREQLMLTMLADEPHVRVDWFAVHEAFQSLSWEILRQLS
jgi:hypothetical protein